MNEPSITASFKWDDGDRSVGIQPGWGEDTGATVRFGPWSIEWLFVVEDEKSVSEWPVEDIQLAYTRDNVIVALADGTSIDFAEARNGRCVYTPPQVWQKSDEEPFSRRRQAVLGDFPDVCEVVESEWEKVQRIEAKNLEQQEEMFREMEKEANR